MTIEEKIKKQTVDELRDRAGRLHYHDAKEVKLTENEFAVLFVENELTGTAKTVGGDVLWYFLGLKVIKTGDISRGN